ncbi:VOC family protein [Herpetosiphon llansteffanensis]|uniref:VOC family protein n=1 Tax=Herpetosiphon llansteffanensis TaxID=2094568 RepID=UPI000D7D0143|nr:VOC family protein [Herpetosiphon llansteffanensis]
MTNQTSWTDGAISAITLFVPDAVIQSTTQFYQQTFGLPMVFSDENSMVFQFGSTLINLLTESAAVELLDPMAVPKANSRALYTITVSNTDQVYAELRERGVEFINGPIDRSWGVRTASFADPAGHLWELAQPL